MKARPASAQALIVFLKAPRPGQVKTRLALTLGKRAACAAYRTLVDCLLQRIEPIKELELHYTPPGAGRTIRPWLRRGWSARRQSSGNLGRRMHHAFREGFRRGRRSIVLIGADCPWITPGDIRKAWKALETHDLVLGPARDGGYWLIGLKEPQPALFRQIPWSGPEVFSTTLARARESKLRTKILRKLTDVDNEREWRLFQSRVRRRGAGCRSESRPRSGRCRARGPRSK